MRDYVKIASLLVKMYFFGLNKVIRELVCQVAPKNTAAMQKKHYN